MLTEVKILISTPLGSAGMLQQGLEVEVLWYGARQI